MTLDDKFPLLMLYLDTEIKPNASGNVILPTDLSNCVSARGKNSPLSFFSMLLSKAIDKTTIDDLLLELTIDRKVLIRNAS